MGRFKLRIQWIAAVYCGGDDDASYLPDTPEPVSQANDPFADFRATVPLDP